MAAFRETYSELHELRSLAPTVNILALTATATSCTRETITEVLLMKDCHVISESPSKTNIAYSVLYMGNDKPIEEYFQWLVDEVTEEKIKATRTIIYCQTIKQCGTIYSTLRGMLGDKLYADGTNDMRKVVLEMLHSCTPDQNKEAILDAFQKEDSLVRILVATIAFGMGVDCKGVYRTIHFGPSKNIEAYIQETGRAGRDGKQSVAYVIYKGLFLNHVDKEMKNYLKTSDCRRKTLLLNFDTGSTVSLPHPMHMCCDNCAIKCECGASDCGQLTTFPGTRTIESKTNCSRTRQGTVTQWTALRGLLYSYHRTLVLDLIAKSNGEQVKSLTKPQVLLRFSDLQVSQVLEHVNQLFTVGDICSHVEIWDMRHAFKILEFIGEVYGDICDMDMHDFVDDEFQCDFDCDDDVNEHWDDLLNDDSLFELAIENISLSELENTTCIDVSQDHSGNCDVPGAALDAFNC